MQALERPALRPYLEPAQNGNDPYHVYLVDRLGLAPSPWRMTMQEYFWVRLFDGRRSLHDIQAEAMRQAGGQVLPLELFASLAEKLDQALLLDGPTFRQLVNGSVRPPRCIGCYQGEPRSLRRQIEKFFTDKKGPGLPGQRQPDGRLHAAFIPHIDYLRGGHTYAWGYKEIFERCHASLFVIIGTSHYSTQRFTLTRKDFQTPLGLVHTDQDYIDRLVRHYGSGLFDDEQGAHLPEHSIELEAVFLQYLYEAERDFHIVPLVVGSFYDCVQNGSSPLHQSDIARMVEALRCVEAEIREPLCYIISGDLAHLGPKFGDPLRVQAPLLENSRRQDRALLDQAEAADAEGFFRLIAAEGDQRRICGLPPAYTLLKAIQPARGRLLHYDQYVHPAGYESVSFASVAFYR